MTLNLIPAIRDNLSKYTFTLKASPFIEILYIPAERPSRPPVLPGLRACSNKILLKYSQCTQLETGLQESEWSLTSRQRPDHR